MNRLVRGIRISESQAGFSLADLLAAVFVSLVACMGFANITAGCFPAQAYASITNAPDYRSAVTITDYVVNGNIARKRVDVDVFYRPIVAWGALATERSVRLSTLIANHT